MRGWKRLLSCGAAVVLSSGVGRGQIAAFVELDAGRGPLTAAFGQARRSLDIYLFDLTDVPIASSLASAVSRGVVVRALVEPCPGDSTCPKPNKDGMTACNALVPAGVQAKWANPAFPKTHAKTMVIDGAMAMVTTINLEAQSFSIRRDYGLSTNDPAVIADFNRVFAQDWQSDAPMRSCSEMPSERSPDATIQNYATLIVSPDHSRAQILGLIGSARSSLKIQMEQVDPQNSRGIVAALVGAVKAGVRLQMLISDPADQPDNQTVANAVNAAGGVVRFQENLKPHAKMMVIDGQKVFMGSQNLTQDSLDLRREIGWVTADQSTLNCFNAVFDADWAGTGTSFLVDGACPQDRRRGPRP